MDTSHLWGSLFRISNDNCCFFIKQVSAKFLVKAAKSTKKKANSRPSKWRRKDSNKLREFRTVICHFPKLRPVINVKCKLKIKMSEWEKQRKLLLCVVCFWLMTLNTYYLLRTVWYFIDLKRPFFSLNLKTPVDKKINDCLDKMYFKITLKLV